MLVGVIELVSHPGLAETEANLVMTGIVFAEKLILSGKKYLKNIKCQIIKIMNCY
jgi:hypothetical protein